MRTKMDDRRIVEIPYAETALEEALFRLRIHNGDGWFDAAKQALILTE